MAFKPLSPVRSLIVVLAAAGAVAALTARAADTAPAERPARGDRMSAVEQHYGAPATRYAAVGTPAITRWDYPGMIVYFENDRVIHAVIVTAATAE